MKKSVIIFIVLINIRAAANSTSNSYNLQLPPDTTVLPSILSLNLDYYIGKPVDSLLCILPSGFSSRGFMPVGVGYTKGVYQSYFIDTLNNCAVEIYIDKFCILPIPNRKPTTKWNMNLAKQETIAFIRVIKNNNICVHGCNNPNYYD